MIFFKSVVNAIGSGAGVAWPLFGILFALLGGSVASFFSLTFAIISIALFFMVSLPVFYFSYQEMKEHEEILQVQLFKNQNKLLADIKNYIETLEQYAISEKKTVNREELFKRILMMDLNTIASEDANSPLYSILLLLYEEYKLKHTLPSNPIIMDRIMHTISLAPVPLSKKIVPSFFSFVGTFGSLTGCSAGVSGLLSGIGLFSSFTVYPLLGGGILVGALILGGIMAYNSMLKAVDDYKKNLLNQSLKAMHRQLSKATIEREINTKLNQAFNNLSEQKDTKEGSAPNQPGIIESFSCRPIAKKSFTFLSFFKVQQTDFNKPQNDGPPLYIFS
ncbi:hypothetical protein [Fluoribacter dumoffii]|uniref:Uncharacterized protein n=1 Tax=Fluoribacter dumoffii TaxID=463 RepID=A0A377GEH2_9GAMM|nr:hypothetical protein [Fluoribacter dumoffii]KTC91490.1 hypothetical protein Ldum_2558 [Fluoribacter dumoffii NY 23]STO23195.1 Uncharacterised protein [Fluoribacter dumoffii]